MRFPEFSGEWKTSSIGEQFELYSGNTPNRMNKNLFDGSINWITSGELKAHYISDTKEKISEDAVRNNNLKILPIGTFVIAIYGLEADGVRGTCSITTKESTISQACMAFTSKKDIQNEFLYSWYKKHGNVIGIKYAQGTKQQNLSYDIIEKFNLSYPCIEEQERLIRFISLIDERIATQNKIIEKLESLIRGIVTKICSGAFVKGEYVFLRDILIERHIKNTENYEVYSVSVSQGIINQIDYLGRSFAAKETLHYNVVNYGDIVYTKSPTGDFPYGIVKRSHIQKPVAVSPLYGVYQPKNDYIGKYLHLYFKSPINTKNYLHRLIQKGAKNTINITNSHFLDSNVFIPEKTELINIVNLTSVIEDKLILASRMLDSLKSQKGYLLSKIFI